MVKLPAAFAHLPAGGNALFCQACAAVFKQPRTVGKTDAKRVYAITDSKET